MNNYLKEIKALIILLILVALFSTLAFLFDLIIKSKITIIVLSVYFILFLFLSISTNFIKNKVYLKVVNIFSFPMSIIFASLIFIIPIGTIIMHTMLYVIVVAFPIIVFKGLIYFKIIENLTPELVLYIEITLAVFLSVLLNYQIRKFIYLISPARIHSSEKLKSFGLDKLTDYLLSENNIRFMIYSLYVIILIVMNVFKFQEKSLLINSTSDQAILQSFITFIAFDRALALLKQLEFKPSDMVSKIIASMKNKLNDFDKKNYS